eukprot:2087907-Rhodomonas_salina.1
MLSLRTHQKVRKIDISSTVDPRYSSGAWYQHTQRQYRTVRRARVGRKGLGWLGSREGAYEEHSYPTSVPDIA